MEANNRSQKGLVRIASLTVHSISGSQLISPISVFLFTGFLLSGQSPTSSGRFLMKMYAKGAITAQSRIAQKIHPKRHPKFWISHVFNGGSNA